MKSIFAIIPLLMLAACQSPSTSQGQSPAHTQAEDECGAASRQNLVGTAGAALDRSALPKNTRIIHPDTVVTMDYLVQRLNVYVGKDGKIERVTCG